MLGGVLLSTHDLYRYAERLDRMERKVDDIHRVLVEAWDLAPVGGEAAAAELGSRSPAARRITGKAAPPSREGTLRRSTSSSAVGSGLVACKLCSPNGLAAAAR